MSKWTQDDIDRLLNFATQCQMGYRLRMAAAEFGRSLNPRRTEASVMTMLWKIPTRYGFWKNYKPGWSRESRAGRPFSEVEMQLLKLLFQNPDSSTTEYASGVLSRPISEIEAYINKGRKPLGVFHGSQT